MRRATLTAVLILFSVCLAAPVSAVSTAAGGTAGEYEQACREALDTVRLQKQALEDFKGEKTVASVLDPFNILWMGIDEAQGRAWLYREVHPDQEVRKAAEECDQQVQQIITDLSLSRPLYDSMQAIDVKHEDAVTQRYLERILRDFRRAGVDRDEATRRRVDELKAELVKIGQEFAANIREDVRRIELTDARDLAGLPGDYIEAHAPDEAGRIVITTDYTDYIPFMKYAENDRARLNLYRVFLKRGHPQNFAVLQRMLEKRHELATLLGYGNWAEYVTEDKMIRTADAADAFIRRISEISGSRAQADYQVLLAYLQRTKPGAVSVGDWQKNYLKQKVSMERYGLDPGEVRTYFPYENVKRGILDITSEMFGIAFRKIDADVWHESVEAWEVREGDRLLGRFYLDMHPREGKFKHAAAFPVRSGVRGARVPEAALVCNLPGGDAGPGLMEHEDVKTFLHEFGHLLHHILGGDQRWVRVNAFDVEWDFGETPSQLLEEWIWSYPVLKKFARNGQGEVIPESLVGKMRAANEFGKGLWVKHQMFYAALSLAYYNNPPGDPDTTALVKQLQDQYSPFDYVDDTYFQLSFGHLDDYSAVYYTYMWSLVIAKDMFTVFEKEGLLNPEPVGRYREAVLAPGGSVDANEMVKNFLGRPYRLDAFSDWLAR